MDLTDWTDLPADLDIFLDNEANSLSSPYSSAGDLSSPLCTPQCDETEAELDTNRPLMEGYLPSHSRY